MSLRGVPAAVYSRHDEAISQVSEKNEIALSDRCIKNNIICHCEARSAEVYPGDLPGQSRGR
jgi:hypothetical protein